MSADMMIITKEDDSHFEGKGTGKAMLIDETSMGEPWTEFGKWFQERYSGAPGMLEQLHGINEHNYIEFTKEDATAAKAALKRLEHREGIRPALFDRLVGKHISTENW